jgi:hypothetical protein
MIRGFRIPDQTKDNEKTSADRSTRAKSELYLKGKGSVGRRATGQVDFRPPRVGGWERLKRLTRQRGAEAGLDFLRDLGLLRYFARLDGQELGVDRRKDTSLRDGDSTDCEK